MFRRGGMGIWTLMRKFSARKRRKTAERERGTKPSAPPCFPRLVSEQVDHFGSNFWGARYQEMHVTQPSRRSWELRGPS
jgi:hypothetical protein